MIAVSETMTVRWPHNVIDVTRRLGAGDDRSAGYANRPTVTIALRAALAES